VRGVLNASCVFFPCHWQNAAIQEAWRMGADSFRVRSVSGVTGSVTMSTSATLMSEASFSIREGQSLARQLSALAVPGCVVPAQDYATCSIGRADDKMRLLEEQLVELVNIPNPGVSDMSLEGLVRWAPESVVAKVRQFSL
jgi:hypothetical protein